MTDLTDLAKGLDIALGCCAPFLVPYLVQSEGRVGSCPPLFQSAAHSFFSCICCACADSSSASAEAPDGESEQPSDGIRRIGPAALRLLRESGLSESDLRPTGPRGILTKADVLAAMKETPKKKAAEPKAEVRSCHVATSTLQIPCTRCQLSTITDLMLAAYIYLSASEYSMC